MASLGWSSITDTCDFEKDNIGDEFSSGCDVILEQAPVYGRKKETLALLNGYQRLVETNQLQVVAVHGESGSGKTALVDLLRDHVCNETSGYFVAGKYFQNVGGSIQEAHSAILAAFSDLCDLVAQSDGFYEHRQQIIRGAMGSDTQLLLRSISNLAPFVLGAASQPIETRGPVMGKFKVACKTFLRAMASNEHPVVIFLDDIQWADEGSRHLIEIFIQDSELKNVMLILAYRDEEAVLAERVLAHAERAPLDIHLSKLEGEAVFQMVSLITGSTSQDTRSLSELVAKRTAGNPFHVMVFMDMIQRERLLFFEHETNACSFNVDEIQREIMASQTLADLLTQKVQLLSIDVTETMKVASLLGYSFDEPIIIEVASNTIPTEAKNTNTNDSNVKGRFLRGYSRTEILKSLSDAVREGFIETTSSGGFQFTHDKLQASFQSLISESEQEQLHLIIGRAFLSSCTKKTQMYNAAVHLNRAPCFMQSTQSNRIELARINFDAAKYCEEKSAFIQAVKMLQSGLASIGPEERWSEDNFDLSFQMMESLARTQLIVGDFEGCKVTTKEALDQGKSAAIKIKLLLIDVEVRMAGIEVKGSLAAAYRALTTLGVHLPRKTTLLHVATKLLKLRWMLNRKTDEDMLNLATTQDLMTTSTVKLLMFVCCYSFVQNDEIAGVHAALLAAELSLTAGLSPYGPASFVLYGVTEMSLGKVERAYRYSKLALAMLEKMPSKEAECYTIGFATTMIIGRRESFCQLVDPLHRVADAGYQRGDVVYATYSSAQSFHLHNYLGTHLATVEALMRDRCETVVNLGQDCMLLWFQPALQYVLNMQSDSISFENIAVLSGEVMSEEGFFRQVHEVGHVLLSGICCLVKAEIASCFEQFSLAALMYSKVETIEKLLQISYAAPFYYGNAARVHFRLYELTGKRKYSRSGRRLRKLLECTKSTDCPNATAMVALLNAEKLAHRKNIEESALRIAYDTGIQCLLEHKLLPYEAILNERAGFDFAQRGMRVEAEQYFDRALHIYKYEWGATAKYIWLTEKREYALRGLIEVEVGNPYGACIRVTPTYSEQTKTQQEHERPI